MVPFELVDGIPVGPLRLVLQEQLRVSGTVIGPTSPVAQAFVIALPISERGTPAGMAAPTAHSGVDGRFDLLLPPETSFAHLAVLSPGYVFHLMRVSVEAKDSPLIRLRQHGGGTLTLPPQDSRRPGARLVMINGQPTDVHLLAQWAQASGVRQGDDGGLVVPAMPAGSYAYCQVAPEEAMRVVGGLALPKESACSEGYLAESAELELSSPRDSGD